MNKKIIDNNKKAWNEALLYHKQARNGKLHTKFASSTFTTFNNSKADIALLSKIKKLNLQGKTVAHMQTNNGRELISLMRISNAKYGVGFDFSFEAIKEAKELSEIAKVNTDFECVDIQKIDKKYNNFFDMIYITEGSLSWLPDMNKYFSVMSRIIKKKGIILISEIHPIGFVLDDGSGLVLDYNQKGPYKLLTGLDYVGKTDYTADDCYWYMHKFSDIIMALIKNGFKIKEFEESNFDTGWIDPNNSYPNFPRSFTLVVEKE